LKVLGSKLQESNPPISQYIALITLSKYLINLTGMNRQPFEEFNFVYVNIILEIFAYGKILHRPKIA